MKLLHLMRRLLAICGMVLGLISYANAETVTPFDHSVWNDLLRRHVHWAQGGHATTVDYRAMTTSKDQLHAYLASLSAVPRETFEHWPAEAQLAFLINAYNAFTVQLILTGYPGLSSIKDLGSWLQSPWKKPFVYLLGQTRSLDDIEQGLIRGSGRYHDPRIHFAINCASIGCPALRPEAYTPLTLDVQLEDQARRFLSDRTRQKISDGELTISPIFKWYHEDFEKGFHGDRSLQEFLARYAGVLGLTDRQAHDLRLGQMVIRFNDYDWRLNDGRNGS